MKRPGRFLGNLLAMVLAVISIQAMAETQLGGRDFNHMTTGFPLSGGHATAACETCHVGGVFKGTPRNCDGCHALGKRVVATPKPNSHIVTDAPCESCHFNTSTFLGARFNHATARPGDCTSCHNGRIAQTKPSKHISTNASCDQCHRSSTWTPATWNHSGAQYVGQDCKVCHNGGTARTFTNASWHSSYSTVGIANCNSCHKNYVSFYINRYDHNPLLGDCVLCHKNPALPGIKGIPTNHLNAFTAGLISPMQCQGCHTSSATWAGMNHALIVPGTPCKACHLKGTANFAGMTQKSYGHEGFSSGQDCISCHRLQYNFWNEP